MSQIFTLITQFFAAIINQLYQWTGNYGVAIILFTIVVKVLMLPLSVRQHKYTTVINRIQPKIKAVQNKYKADLEKFKKDAARKYKDDKAKETEEVQKYQRDNMGKQNEELQAIYKENDVSMSSGCLPLLIQLPIMWALFQVISRPMTYIMGLAAEKIAEIQQVLSGLGAETAGEIPIIREVIARGLSFEGFHPIDFRFLMWDLSEKPNMQVPSWLWLIPILSALFTWLSSKQMQAKKPKDEKKKGQPENQMEQANSTMTVMMPLMSAWFTFAVPSGLGLYWIMNSVTQIIQTYILNKIFMNKIVEETKEEIKKEDKKKKIVDVEPEEDSAEDVIEEVELEADGDSEPKKNDGSSKGSGGKPNPNRKKKK